MSIFEINKEYLLKLGEADPIISIYLGIKGYKRNSSKHIFVVYGLCNGTQLDPRFYLGKTTDTLLKEGMVHIKNPVYKKINGIERKVLNSLIEKLKTRDN